MKQNITLSLEKDIIRKAKILAAKKHTSISRLLGEELARIVVEDDQYQSAKRRAVARLQRGFRLGGKILATREELHERG